jgi:hypothetical protein
MITKAFFLAKENYRIGAYILHYHTGSLVCRVTNAMADQAPR